VFAIIEHEAMHQETLLYMWHRLPYELKRRPAGYAPQVDGAVPVPEWIEVAPGRAATGVDRSAIAFGWDNEFPAAVEEVPAFAVQRHDVTNAAFLEFVDAGGYTDPRWWSAADWEWLTKDGLRHPLFWERQGDAWFW